MMPGLLTKVPRRVFLGEKLGSSIFDALESCLIKTKEDDRAQLRARLSKTRDRGFGFPSVSSGEVNTCQIPLNQLLDCFNPEADIATSNDDDLTVEIANICDLRRRQGGLGGSVNCGIRKE